VEQSNVGWKENRNNQKVHARRTLQENGKTKKKRKSATKGLWVLVSKRKTRLVRAGEARDFSPIPVKNKKMGRKHGKGEIFSSPRSRLRNNLTRHKGGVPQTKHYGV